MTTALSPRPRPRGWFTAALLGLTTLTAGASPFSDQLLRDEAFWGDGKAEMTVFRGTEKRYGVARETEVRHILVRESFAAEERVKADDWRSAGAYPVIKLNQIITVPTGTYRYDQGVSTFWRAADGVLIKLSHTTNDSCGLAYKQGELEDDGHWRQRVFTYWQGMSEVDTRTRRPATALFYDELPFRLRLLDWERAQTGPFRVPVMASVVGSRAEPVAWPEAEITTSREAGDWRVSVAHARGTDVFFFDSASPHGLRRWERWDQTTLDRHITRRLPYWELNRPGDESLLDPTRAE
jgi:hypothetical protein